MGVYEVPNKIQKGVNGLDNALFFLAFAFAFDRVDSWLNGKHASNADDDGDHRRREIIKKCSASHTAACPCVQLRQTCDREHPSSHRHRSARAGFTTPHPTSPVNIGSQLLQQNKESSYKARPTVFTYLLRPTWRISEDVRD